MTEGIHYSKHLEGAILGLCLEEKDAFGRFYGLLESNNFYFQDNQKVHRCMAEMYDQNIPIDLMTVWQRMTEKNETLYAGNISWYLTTRTNYVTHSINLEYWCYLIKNMWRKRELERITRSGIDSSGDVIIQINELNQHLSEIRGSEYKKDWYDMSELMYDLLVHQIQISEGKKELITTGFKKIDRENGGFSPGQMIVIGARPSMGKSAFMGKMAIQMAKQGKKVGIISLEMNNNEIAARLASLETEINFSKIYRNLFTDESENQRFYSIVSKQTVDLPIYISDRTKVDINEIRAKTAKLMHKQGCDCLMIDYLQLVDSVKTDNRNYNREQEVSKISRGLKLLAMEMQIPVIVLCQLNRAVTGRSAKDRYPKLSDLRESGAIEQDADIVMMLHRDWMSGYESHDDGRTTELEADLLGLKWRNGATFHIPLDFDPPKMKFSEKKESAWRPVTTGDLFDDDSPI